MNQSLGNVTNHTKEQRTKNKEQRTKNKEQRTKNKEPMNIVCRKTNHCDKDPFDSSDRDFQGGAGKGDRNRSISRSFSENFPASMGPRGKRKPGKITFRYN